MEKFFVLFSLFLTANSIAAQLHNYSDIKSALLNGKKIHILVDLSKCPLTPHPADDNYSVYTPNETSITPDRIAASVTHFTLLSSQGDKPVYDFIRYNIASTNQVTLTHAILDAASYQFVEQKHSVDCMIDNGVTIFADVTA
jgi:hypothetical protein